MSQLVDDLIDIQNAAQDVFNDILEMQSDAAALIITAGNQPQIANIRGIIAQAKVHTANAHANLRALLGH